jgi:hypothetical protein
MHIGIMTALRKNQPLMGNVLKSKRGKMEDGTMIIKKGVSP